ncbi:hypothetical protein DSO57_1012446 [Entomophthora muscae]|uniref:Uncharacterized protein n=1 Tax=Entomophthora muscae TaxID=34485 RepID=A0ACC2S822_9FUNG|nr:hypothetical protein DSO57_1012446 [Entomophthora muscae]
MSSSFVDFVEYQLAIFYLGDLQNAAILLEHRYDLWAPCLERPSATIFFFPGMCFMSMRYSDISMTQCTSLPFACCLLRMKNNTMFFVYKLWATEQLAGVLDRFEKTFLFLCKDSPCYFFQGISKD